MMLSLVSHRPSCQKAEARMHCGFPTNSKLSPLLEGPCGPWCYTKLICEGGIKDTGGSGLRGVVCC